MPLFRLLAWAVLIYVGYKIIQGFIKGKQQEQSRVQQPKGEETFRDPVCGTYVSEDDAVIGRVEGQRFHFCSRECLEQYRQQLAQQAGAQLKN